MKKITFFFGSGADTDYCQEMPSGEAFSSALLSDDFKRERTILLGENTASLYLITYNSRKFFLQTIANYCNSCNRQYVENIFSEEVVERCLRVYDPSDVVNEADKETVANYCHEWYYCIKEQPEKLKNTSRFRENSEEIREFFLKNGQFFDTLDEKFNALRFYNNSNNARRVMNAYTAVYCLMLSKVYPDRFPDSRTWTYKEIFALLQDEYTCKLELKVTYYALLRDYIAKTGRENSWIVTSNYTSLAEKCIQNEINDVAVIYLHGKLSWFEDLEKLIVYDVTVDSERNKAEAVLDNVQESTDSDAKKKTQSLQNKIIPFILIPSGIKPLICTRQIEEFHKFIEGLDNSDELCIIGYRFNSEDNHINSIIGDWLRKESNHKLVFFNYENSIDISKLSWLSNIEMVNIEDIEKIDSCEAQVLNIEVKKTTAEDYFNKYLNLRTHWDKK